MDLNLGAKKDHVVVVLEVRCHRQRPREAVAQPPSGLNPLRTLLEQSTDSYLVVGFDQQVLDTELLGVFQSRVDSQNLSGVVAALVLARTYCSCVLQNSNFFAFLSDLGT